MRVALVAVGGALALLALACESPDGTDGPAQGAGGPPDVVVEDSAGVEVVLNPAGADEAARRWSVNPEPILEIGVLEGEAPYEFGSLIFPERLTDGTIVVVDSETREVRFFDEEGRHRRTTGGEGEGPGEFNLPAEPHRLPGDSLAVFDMNLFRITLFDRTGEVVDVVRPDGPAAAPPRAVLDEWVLVTRRSLAGGFIPGEVDEEEVIHVEFAVERVVGLQEPEVDTLTTVPGRSEVRWFEGGRGGGTPVPYTLSSPLTAHEGHLVLASRTEPHLRVYDAAGELVRIIQLGEELPALDPADWEAEVERRLEAAEGDVRERWERHFEVMAPPPTVPAFSALLPDDEGRIWARRFEPHHGATGPAEVEAPSTWVIFDEQGRVAGTAELPPRFEPRRVTPAGVLGLYRDELDVVYVRLLEVEAPPAS